MNKLPEAYTKHIADIAYQGIPWTQAQNDHQNDVWSTAEYMAMAHDSPHYTTGVIIGNRDVSGKPVTSYAWMVSQHIKDTHRDCNYHQTATQPEAVY